MLVLTRRKDRSVIIGKREVVVKVVGIVKRSVDIEVMRDVRIPLHCTGVRLSEGDGELSRFRLALGSELNVSWGNIKLVVKEINLGSVVFAVNAPKEVSVHRDEIYENIEQGRGTKQQQKKHTISGLGLGLGVAHV